MLLPADRPSRGAVSSAPKQPASSGSRQARKRKEWRGNLILILAIATLVGVATFVVVRERVEEQRRQPHGEPAHK